MSNNVATIYFDPKFVERAKKGEWPAERVPKWLLDGNFVFQHDSIRYFLKAGQRAQLSEDIAIHAVRKSLFQAHPLTGAPIKAISIINRLKGGAMNETNCTVCGQDQQSLEKLAEHILGHAAERRYDATGGACQEPVDDSKPSGKATLKLPEDEDAGSGQFPSSF